MSARTRDVGAPKPASPGAKPLSRDRREPMMVGATRREALHQVLTREAGTGADARAIAEGVARLCERVVQQLTPVIGRGGVAATCDRAVHLSQREFPWLAPVRRSDQCEGLFADLQTSLAQQERAVADAAGVAVLTSIVDLLASLIGESLTMGLLHEAWPARSSNGPGQEHTS